ncbi:hypothetical protein DSO57_1031675 [Entomophthora muscae]|uniref:Uncharacterized protein n=1 Tax=Entomophthora muscae TaxID=34485 RepID=A0ACC2T0T3_9FUNG|nr:hypothetical protein DSO57_1031675 [Entomophthora muscae]
MNCNRRKQKCDLKLPCTRCYQLKTSCVYAKPGLSKSGSGGDSKNSTLTRIKGKEEKIIKILESLGMFPETTEDSLDLASTSSQTDPLNEYGFGDKCLALRDLSSHRNTLFSKDIRLQLIQIYFSLHNRVNPYIDESAVRTRLESNQLGDAVLTYSIMARAFTVFAYLNTGKNVSFKENVYYLKARGLVNQLESQPTLKLVQSILLLAQIEAFEGELLAPSLNLAKAIRYSQMLGFDRLPLDYLGNMPALDERVACWSLCMELDGFISMFFNSPPNIQQKPLQRNLLHTQSLEDLDFNSVLESPFVSVEVAKVTQYTNQLFWEFKKLSDERCTLPSKDVLSRVLEIYACVKPLSEIPWVAEESKTLFQNDINILALSHIHSQY